MQRSLIKPTAFTIVFFCMIYHVCRKKNLTMVKGKKNAMKRNESRMVMHLLEDTNDSHNMFEGYYGRRRLKNTIVIFFAFLILLALFYRRQESGYASPITSTRTIQNKTAAPPIAPVEKSGVLSSITFSNSPYLNIDSFPDNFVPIMVLSKASHIEVRDAIRRTWGYYRWYRDETLRIKIFFLVGTDDFMTQRIRMEQIVFDDVIQVSVPDMYSFSAYKELAAMIWIRSYLPNSRFYIKTEDDVILNMITFVSKLLPIIEAQSNQNLVIGWFGSEHTIQRGTYQKFIDAVVPVASDNLNYAMSLLYAVTAIAADNMIAMLTHVELIEYPGDPFVTGILRDAAHVEINNLALSSERFKYEIANGACKLAFTKDPSVLICTSSLHAGSMHSMPEYFEAWNVLIGEKQP